MPCAPLLRFTDYPATDTRAEAGEVMSGLLEATGASHFASTGRSPNRSAPRRPSIPPPESTKIQRVFVRVYRTSSEHFAVLYPARAIVTACRPLASINLKSSLLKELPNQEFSVSPRSMEGASVTFKCNNEGQISEWLQAFSEAPQDSKKKRVSDHRLPLPVLIESEEDESATE